MGIEDVSRAVHSIRLRGFWASSALPDGRTCQRRRFGRPTVSDPREQIWLVCDELPQSAVIRLNGEFLAEGSHMAIDVGDRLSVRNELAIETNSLEPPDDVRLEIREGESG